MEAMAAGLLVIGSEVGGQPEMLSNGYNALTSGLKMLKAWRRNS
jgi:hypothetical protein